MKNIKLNLAQASILKGIVSMGYSAPIYTIKLSSRTKLAISLYWTLDGVLLITKNNITLVINKNSKTNLMNGSRYGSLEECLKEVKKALKGFRSWEIKSHVMDKTWLMTEHFQFNH